MDLLGNLGNDDQLVSARAENGVLMEKVNALSLKVRMLEAENASLLVEVEMYRKEALLRGGDDEDESKKDSISNINNNSSNDNDDIIDAFVKSGNGVYASWNEVTLTNTNQNCNPLCCALNESDTLLATGGADKSLSVFQWGAALNPTVKDAAKTVVDNAARAQFSSPIIATAFSNNSNNSSNSSKYVAAGAMDGSVHVCALEENNTVLTPLLLLDDDTNNTTIKHSKYVKNVVWSPSSDNNYSILASASADGTLKLHRVNNNIDNEISLLETLHLSGAIEAMCFLDHGNTLCCYTRNTSYLSYFHLDDQCRQTKHSLNGGGSTTNNAFVDDHVSFAVMSLSPSPDYSNKYVAAATDSSRNIILKSHSPTQIRNLYGHTNDSYSQPKISWSSSGQYIYGNTQTDNCVHVWDCASSSIVERLSNSNSNSSGGGQLRDLYSSPHSDTLVTVSFDKTAKIWLPKM